MSPLTSSCTCVCLSWPLCLLSAHVQKQHVCSSSWLHLHTLPGLLLSYFPHQKKKAPKKKGPCVIVKVLLLTGEIHLATWAVLKVLSFKTRIQADQLFPYIDLPAIILSSNVLDNRATSERAITDKQCDNMRSVRGLALLRVRVTQGPSISRY